MAAGRKKASANKGSIADLLRQAGKDAKVQSQEALEQQQLEITVKGELPKPKQPRIFDILNYIESDWGLQRTLYPVQKFIVKLYYNIPLDDKNRTIEIADIFNGSIKYRFTEKDYLKFLYSEQRCNIQEQDYERKQLILACGRRGGKTTLSGIFASYEVYRLLNMHNPQDYYGLPAGNRIQIVSVAGDKEQASLLFSEVASHVAHCSYFKPYLASDTKSDIKFRTPYDIEKFGTVSRYEGGKFQSLNGKATLRVTFKGSNSRGLRGPGNIVIILDEMAHYQEDGHSGAKQIYDALTPSTAAFSPKDPSNPVVPIGPNEGRVICISSPLNRAGKFYDLFHAAMKGAHGMLAIQAPTWEMNPTVSTDYYREKYSADPATFEVEHGANFSDRVRGWIEREQDLMACVNAEKRPILQGTPRYPYQLGLDIGVTAGGDGTAVAITYADGDKISLAYHEYWQAGVDWMESNPHLGGQYSCDYARKLKDVDQLDFTEIEEWVLGLTRRFNIINGLFDRWQGMPLEQGFTKRGFRHIRSEFFTRDVSSKMFQAVKMLMLAGKLDLYDFPIPEKAAISKHSPLIAELLTLQAEAFSKHLIVVAAPKQKGHHDDMSVALVRSIFLTMENMGNMKHVYHPSNETRSSAGPTLHGYQMQRARNHGFVSERRRPTGRMGRLVGGRGRSR